MCHLNYRFAVAGACLVLVGSAFLVNQVFASNGEQLDFIPRERLINIYDHAKHSTVVTKAQTVRDVLKVANIAVNDKQDLIEPSLDSPVATEKFHINIYRARPVTIVDGSVRRKLTTAQQTPAQIARAAGLKLYTEDKVTFANTDNLLVDGADLVMNIHRATEISAVLYGQPMVVRTHAKTVGDFLKERKIQLAPQDTLSISAAARILPGMKIELWRNGKQTVTVEEEVDFPTERIQDANRDSGYYELKQAGEKGKRKVTYEIEMRNGKEIGRRTIASATIKEPKKKVEFVGAKVKYSGGPLSEEQITALGRCESGMTATRNSGNGYYGAFQFSAGTWRSNAPDPYKSVLPHQAPLDAQKQAVQNLLSRSSIFNQFPGCAKKMRSQGVI